MKSKKKEINAEAVTEFMNKLIHPYKAEIEKLRVIIKNTDTRIQERIKWNAPSYYLNSHDLLTFNPRAARHIHLVFHHPAIVNIQSDLLEGDYKDRRMTYVTSMNDVQGKKAELERVLKKLLAFIDLQ